MMTGQWWRARRWLAAAGLVAVFVVGWFRSGPRPTPPTEIFQGVTYCCFEIVESDEGRGLVHLVEVDLAAPGIELYVTPLDPDAVRQGYQYRLRFARRVAARERLAVLINASLFEVDLKWLPLPGQLTRACQTLVADGVVNDRYEHSYLLWFDPDGTPHLETRKPPPDAALQNARWAVSGQSVALLDGRVRRGHGPADRRTMIAFDAPRKRLWLAVFEHASSRLAAQTLADAGATAGVLLDGGSSTAMVIGRGAGDVPSGSVLGGWRPVPTFFGVRAPRLESPATAQQLRPQS